jgi:cytochrome c biogenesis protein CcmG/thiol:disulfide interchange protein DsbE
MSGQERKPRRWAMWLPLALFAAFVALVLVGLYRPADRSIESAMIGKPLPAFELPPAVDGQRGLSSSDFATGQPRLLNIFASWCIPCRVEAPQLAALRQRGIAIDGIAIRDRKEDVATFLESYGNPFERVGADDVSAVQLAIGSSGVPETFVIDGKGVIRYQHIGEIRPDQVPLILEKLEEARR